MEQAISQQTSYALGHLPEELDRLSRQAEAFGPFTRQLFEEAGIRRGMRVLDVGCGSGDVTFLVAEMVGPSGEVIGVDRAPAAVNRAMARAQTKNIGNVKFLPGDPTELQFDRPFDAVVGRLVLMFYPDPMGAIRKLKRHVRVGGLLVFEEFDFSNARSFPPAPTFDRSVAWIRQTLSATGAETRLGLELYSVFLGAGLPAPSMRMDALIGGGPDQTVYENTAEAIKSLLPTMEKLKIASAAEVELPSLAQRMRDEVVASNGVVLSPGLIGAWARRL